MDLNKSITCENCGGNDFVNDGGYYYCTECQTQSQEVQERIFEYNETLVRKVKVQIKKPKNISKQNKLTSWETYNYILHGLVEELQRLGANEKFKEITYHLWLTYLTKLEYITDKPNVLPKLGAVFRKRDAEIVFERRYRRKRKVNSFSSVSISDMNEKMKRLEKSKQRRIMERAEYDNISSTVPTDCQSLANQTLSGLSSDDAASSISGHIAFNEISVKELRKHMSQKHLELHLKDTKNELTCHQNYRELMSRRYLSGPEILTRNKLYCLLYLGLLLSQQEFQISDIIRYCREGHLSFLNYKHFFPDTTNKKTIYHAAYLGGSKKCPSYDYIRKCTFQLYKYFEIRPCDFSPNILKLCRRYCTELNLPDQIYNIAGDYIIKTRPFHLHPKAKRIGNYEGRTMGFIIYVLKVLLSIDDVTENELSKFAYLVNKKNKENVKTHQPELFSFSDWYNYIEYRKIVLKHVHFPTWCLVESNRDCPVDLYVKFLNYKQNDIEEDESSDLSMNIIKKFLVDIKNIQDNTDEMIEFEASLTPFRSYVEKLKTIDNFKVLNQKLNYEIIKDTSKHTIEYLINPNRYLKQINDKKCSIILSNAHPKHKLQQMYTRYTDTDPLNLDLFETQWNKKFSKHKFDQIALDKLVHKIYKKHVYNVQSGSNLEELTKSKPKFLEVPEDKNINKIKNSVGRNSQGKFCKKDDPNAVPPEKITPRKKGKWHVSPWNKTVLQNEYKPSLLYQVTVDEIRKENLKQIMETSEVKHLNKKTKYKYHYIPRMEYCSNIINVAALSLKQWKEYEAKLPQNFQWLLAECARMLEQSTKELFEEFVYVEVYMNYIYSNQEPFICESFNNKSIRKLKQIVKDNW